MSSEVYERLVGAGAADLFAGVAVAIVTNVKDPDGFGRVKLRLPWLSDEVETNWARIATPGPGVTFQPRVNDEVLVAFEHGDPASPFVVGSLWNGKDKPPDPDPEGKGNLQVLRSRSGHVVRLDDTQGKEKIEIIAKGAKNSIVVDVASNTVTITGDSDVVIEAKQGKLTLKGKGVEITSQADLKLKASSGASLEGGPKLDLKGSMVNIN